MEEKSLIKSKLIQKKNFKIELFHQISRHKVLFMGKKKNDRSMKPKPIEKPGI